MERKPFLKTWLLKIKTFPAVVTDECCMPYDAGSRRSIVKMKQYILLDIYMDCNVIAFVTVLIQAIDFEFM